MRAHALYIARLRNSRLRREFHSRVISRVLPRIHEGWVVDIGCGPALLGAGIAGLRPTARTLGVDIDVEMLRVARGTGSRLVCADSSALPFRTGSMDVAVSTASLKDWGDRIGGLAEIRRVTRTDGIAIVADFVTTGPGSRPEHFRSRFGLLSDLLRRVAGLFVPFSMEDARKLADSAGGTTEFETDLGVVSIVFDGPPRP